MLLADAVAFVQAPCAGYRESGKAGPGAVAALTPLVALSDRRVRNERGCVALVPARRRNRWRTRGRWRA